LPPVIKSRFWKTQTAAPPRGDHGADWACQVKPSSETVTALPKLPLLRFAPTNHNLLSKAMGVSPVVFFKNRLWIFGGGVIDGDKEINPHSYKEVWSSEDGINWTQESLDNFHASNQAHKPRRQTAQIFDMPNSSRFRANRFSSNIS